MICEICGKTYGYSCPHCTKRIMTWGQDGLLYLMDLAKQEENIQSYDLVGIIKTYYVGKSKRMSVKVNVLRTALRLLGYKGNFIGRIHNNGMTYVQILKREHETGRRWGLKNESCDKCGSKIDLKLHHIVPISWGGKSTLENCTTLCEVCHRKTHKKLNKFLNREKLLEYLAPHYEEIEALAKQSVL